VSEVPFQPLAALRLLVAHGVRFVLIGGYAANIRGSPVITGDLDICYARDLGNLERLATALQEMEARLRGPGIPDDLPFLLEAKTLEMGDAFTFQTRYGSLDVLGTPSGTGGFKDLEKAATEIEVDGLTFRVASINDLIRMKRASARPKDHVHLEWLKSVRHMIEGDEAT
jgi:hypothetical protein